MKKIIWGIVILIIIIAVAWATFGLIGFNDGSEGDKKLIGLPNPSAVKCVDLGGEYNLQNSNCVLSDGQICDAWELLRTENCVAPTDSVVSVPATTYDEKLQTIQRLFAEDFQISFIGNGDLPGLIISPIEKWYQGTNLSADSFVKVEKSATTESCAWRNFADENDLAGAENKSVAILSNEDGVDSVYFTDAGAGNLYEINLFAKTVGEECLGVKYFVHSTNIGNYEPGTVLPFDQQSLYKSFDEIRRIVFEN
jgi:hypothetical protein